MTSIAEHGLRVKKDGQDILVYLPDGFPFSASSLQASLDIIEPCAEEYSSLSAGFTVQDGMALKIRPKKDDEGSLAAAIAQICDLDLPLRAEQTAEDKLRIQIVCIDGIDGLIEPTQAITIAQFRHQLTCLRPLNEYTTPTQSELNAAWRISLRAGGYLAIHTRDRTNVQELLDNKGLKALLPHEYPHVAQRMTVSLAHNQDGTRLPYANVQVQIGGKIPDFVLEDSPLPPGFAELQADHGYVWATYTGSALQTLDPLKQASELASIMTAFAKSLGIFPAEECKLHLLLAQKADDVRAPAKTFVTHTIGTVSGRPYPWSNR